MSDFGRAAYEGYAQRLSKPMPEWENVDFRFQAAWNAAGLNVVRLLSRYASVQVSEFGPNVTVRAEDFAQLG